MPELSGLRRLVTVLTVVLILAVVAIATVIVIRLGVFWGEGEAPLAPISAERLVLPAAHEIVAIGRDGGGVLIVLRAPDGAEWLHRYDAASGEPSSVTRLERAP